jgi:hypothetical protein
MMDELNPEVRGYLDAAKKAIKAHFAALGEEKSAFEQEWEERIAEMPMAERKALLAILKRMTKANAK